MHHTAISTFGRTSRVSWIQRDYGAADPKFMAAQHMIMFRVVAFVGQYAPWPQIRGGLPHRRREIGRVLTWSQPRNGSRNQLGSRVKHSGQFRPGRMGHRAVKTFPSIVKGNVPSLQSGCINRRRIAGIVRDQATIASTVAASRKESLESPFSRSFCSTCQSVE